MLQLHGSYYYWQAYLDPLFGANRSIIFWGQNLLATVQRERDSLIFNLIRNK